MKLLYRLIIGGILLLGGLSTPLSAQPGDTTWVKTFNFSDPSPTGFSAPYRGSFQFPDTSEQFEKILMYYTLKCDPATNQDGFDCGEWDYLTYTYVVDSSGWFDSTYRSNANFTYLDGSSSDSVSYTFDQTYSFEQEAQPFVTYLDTFSLSTAEVGTGNQPEVAPFLTDELSGKAQFLWTRNDLAGNGLQTGNVTGMRVRISSLGSEVNKLRVRMAHTTEDSLTGFADLAFQEVYYQNTTFADTGWQSLAFYQLFNWNGNDNVVVQFSFENQDPGTTSVVRATTQPKVRGIYSAGRDHYLDLNGNDVVDLGAAPQIQGTAPRTYEAWAYTRSFNNGGMFQAGPTGTVGQDFSLRTNATDNSWRVQMWGTPDFDVTLPGSKNAWHHYAVTYENGQARMYYDGLLIQTESVTINTGASNVWLGRWSGSRFNGLIDEFRMWNVALDESTLADWKDRSVDASHPQFANLVAYLPMDEGTGLTAFDQSGNGHDGALQGPPAWERLPAIQLRRDVQPTLDRPNAIFEQGSFQTMPGTNIITDSLPVSPLQVVLFGNPSGPYIIPDDSPNHPSIATDTLLVYRANRYSPIIGPNGSIVDSVFIPADSTIFRDDHEYYSNIVRYEIGRYITPYGIGLDLGAEGTRWIFEVTDYRPILHDWIYLQSGNNQELLDLQFAMIKGKPARTVRKIENLWLGNYSYTALWNDTQGKAVTKYLDPKADDYRIKMRISGHGFGGPSNCAEFCPKIHSLLLDGTESFAWEVWNECSNNFVYPQGGTWIYDRAGWCPGGIVSTYDHELGDLVSPGDTLSIDYAIADPAPYNPEGNYVMSGQLITYGAPNKQVDVAIDEILAPSSDKRYSRRNPICDNPRIRISNQGALPLTKLNFTFGINGGLAPCYFTWEGNLEFLESTEIDLPRFNWFGLNPTDPTFYVEVSVADGGTDENLFNNRMESEVEVPRRIVNKSIIEIKTNFAAAENSYYIISADGDTVQSRTNMQNNTLYQDTLDFPKGCYTLYFRDDNIGGSNFGGEDGVAWWANNDGNGYVYILNPDGSFQSRYEGDFGQDIYEQFTMWYTMGQTYFPELVCDSLTSTSVFAPLVPEQGLLQAYPNPNDGSFSVHVVLPKAEALQLRVFSPLGKLVYEGQEAPTAEVRIPLNLDLPSGMYMVQVLTPTQRLSQSVFIR